MGITMQSLARHVYDGQGLITGTEFQALNEVDAADLECMNLAKRVKKQQPVPVPITAPVLPRAVEAEEKTGQEPEAQHNPSVKGPAPQHGYNRRDMQAALKGGGKGHK